MKQLFDPLGLMNPGKIVAPSKQDDRSLFRFKPDYRHIEIKPALDWSAHGSLAHATEMCNNNGHCRKFDADVMCPSYRVTHDEQHSTRGRANTLRLALSGQLGDDAMSSEAMRESFDLCVSCKGCKRECPTGVDMAKMKIEYQHQWQLQHGLSIKDKLIAFLPHYAPYAAKLSGLLNLRDASPRLARWSEKHLGLSARRPLPRWRSDYFRVNRSILPAINSGHDVALFVDTFTTYFEPENARAALRVLRAAGFHSHFPRATKGRRPLCCGRTFLSAGLIDRAKFEAERLVDAMLPYVEQNIPIVGLEPSCLFTLRDEFPSLLPGAEAEQLAKHVFTFEEFLFREHQQERLKLSLYPITPSQVLLHGHCHQKAFGVMGAVEGTLKLIPELKFETIASSCCGMAGAFGFDAEHYDVSMAMGELSLLPAVRATDMQTTIVADGVSCRQQIRDGAGRHAVHVARLMADALRS